MISFNYIDRQKDLLDCCSKLQVSQSIAVDTEFVRERTFYPQPGLIQVTAGTDISLIDPNAGLDLQVFFDLLQSADIQIIMHSASEDIELFYHMGCGVIQNLFDTQIAAAWLALGQSLSLQKLIEQYKNITIEKQHSRTNWLRRPLTEAQLNYAAIDVLYLNSICQVQQRLLSENGFLDYMTEDCNLRCEQKSTELNDSQAYLKVKKANSTNGAALTRLKKLASWREQQARCDNKPRQHIIKDSELMGICLQNPKTLEELTQKCEVQAYTVRRYGQQLLVEIFDTEQQGIVDNPALSLRSLNGATNTLKNCRELMQVIHNEHQIPLDVLPSKRWLEQYLLYYVAKWYPGPEGLDGWRSNLLEEPIQQIIDQYHFSLNG